MIRQLPLASALLAALCLCAPALADDPPASPAPQPVDFVCENDVRQAIRAKRKIHIGPKTIVTPSARDLAAADDILVKA